MRRTLYMHKDAWQRRALAAGLGEPLAASARPGLGNIHNHLVYFLPSFLLLVSLTEQSKRAREYVHGVSQPSSHRTYCRRMEIRPYQGNCRYTAYFLSSFLSDWFPSSMIINFLENLLEERHKINDYGIPFYTILNVFLLLLGYL